MALPKFVLGASELQFSRGIQYPTSAPRERLQVVDRTAGGTLQREDLGVNIRTRPITFKNLPKADYDALVAWFDTVCEGSLYEFEYWDEDGQSMQVIMRTNPLDFKQTSYQRYAGELLLEVVG